MRPGPGAVVVAALLLAPAAAPAQFQQYAPPEDIVAGRRPVAAIVEDATAGAKWRLGRLRLDPWIGVRNLNYVDNERAGQEGGPLDDDLTVSVGAGLRAYVPLGAEVTWAAYALPEYSWWRDLDALRQWNGRYGTGFFGDLGRVSLQASAQRTEDARVFSREFEQAVNTRDDRALVGIEVEAGAGVSPFLEGWVREFTFFRQDEAQPPVDVLNREERVARAGLRFDVPGGLRLGVGAERSETEFEDPQSPRANSGTSPLLELDYAGSRLSVSGHLVYLDLEPETGPEGLAFEDFTGEFRVGLRAAGSLEIELFGSRNLVYSFQSTWAYYEDESLGAALHFALGAWGDLRLFGERGSTDYAPIEAGPEADRVDDFDGFGGELSLKLHPRVTLVVITAETDYDSNLPQFDRTVTAVRGGLIVGARSGSPWG